MDDQSRNLILATALSFLVILAWFFLFPPEPPAPTTPAAEAAQDGQRHGTAAPRRHRDATGAAARGAGARRRARRRWRGPTRVPIRTAAARRARCR